MFKKQDPNLAMKLFCLILLGGLWVTLAFVMFEKPKFYNSKDNALLVLERTSLDYTNNSRGVYLVRTENNRYKITKEITNTDEVESVAIRGRIFHYSGI